MITLNFRHGGFPLSLKLSDKKKLQIFYTLVNIQILSAFKIWCFLDSFSKGRKQTTTCLKRRIHWKRATQSKRARAPPAQWCLKQQQNHPWREESQQRRPNKTCNRATQAAQLDPKQPVYLSLSTCPPLNLTLGPVRLFQKVAREEPKLEKIGKESKNLKRKRSNKVPGQVEMTSPKRKTPERVRKWEIRLEAA